MSRFLPLLIAILLLPGLVTADPTIIELYPNPVEYNDRGEYIIVHFQTPTNLTTWSLTDGETTVTFPPTTINGTITLTTDPTHLPGWINHPVIPLNGHLQLANTGDEVTLLNNSTPITTVQYTDAPSARRYRFAQTGWTWNHPATTDFPVTTVSNVTATLFVLPDTPTLPQTALNNANDRILLAGYTYASHPTTTALCAAENRGIPVTVLLDDAPVGGISSHQRDTLNTLRACNATVTTTGGDYAWYAFHHPKYAIIDKSALILTENWKPSGTGGHANRGWGVLIDDPEFTNRLASVFHADHTADATRPWATIRSSYDVVNTNQSTTTYPQTFPPETVHVDQAQLILAPDTAEPTVVNALNDATHTIDIQQVTIGSKNNPFLRATIRAAHRGVTVRILLSSAWYATDDNQALADHLNTYAQTNSIPLQARLINPRTNFEKTHTKGVIIDTDTVILGSINWNNNSIRNNREVAVILHGTDPATYYHTVFTADWNASTTTLPLGFTAVTLTAIIFSARAAHKSVVFQSK